MYRTAGEWMVIRLLPLCIAVGRCQRAAVSAPGQGGAGPASVLGFRAPLHPLGGLQVEPLGAVTHPGGISPSPLALVFVECMSYVFFCAVAPAGTSGTRAPLLVHPRWSWENTIMVPSIHMTQAGTANPHCVTGSSGKRPHQGQRSLACSLGMLLVGRGTVSWWESTGFAGGQFPCPVEHVRLRTKL